MIKLFAILLIILIGILLLVLKKGSFKQLIKKRILYSVKFKKHRVNNIKFLSNKNSFLYNHEEKNYSVFYKNSQIKK